MSHNVYCATHTGVIFWLNIAEFICKSVNRVASDRARARAKRAKTTKKRVTERANATQSPMTTPKKNRLTKQKNKGAVTHTNTYLIIYILYFY